MNATLKKLSEFWRAALPQPKIKSVVEWGKLFVKLPGSALAEAFDPDLTPWNNEPLERTDDGTQDMSYVKPVQTGGSVMGEVAICRQIACSQGGDIQYNWQNDVQSDARWDKRVEPILKACAPVMARAPKDRDKWKIGLIVFPHCNFIMQGVNTNRAVASDSIRWQLNEEVHDAQGGWSPGKLAQAHGRLTAWWNRFAGEISNASYDGDQLHKRFLAGSQQEWMVKCPGCRLYHAMRTAWDAKHPERGGLRYDADGCRLANGEYDYFKLKSTIRFQMPCGFAVPDDAAVRRALSKTGRYSIGRFGDVAGILPRSYTLEAVSIDYIPFLKLIQEKHEALKALRAGDPEPYSVYVRERECRFFKKGLQPIVQNIVLNQDQKKDRDGLPDRMVRLGAADYQQGEFTKGELPHWWHLIVDAQVEPDGRLHTLVVSEGKILTDTDLVDAFERHQVPPPCVLLDSGWNAPHIYQLCLKHGFSCVKGEERGLYAHKDKSRKPYSPPKALHTMIGQPEKYQYIPYMGELIPDPREPLFFFYSKAGMMDRVAWLRTSKTVIFDVPGDVSEDFVAHMDAWQRVKKVNPSSQAIEQIWRKLRERDDLLQCFSYVALQLEDAGLIGIPSDQEEGGANEEEEG